MLHVAGYIDAGDLVLVALGKRQNVLLGLMLRHGEGSVDIDLVGSGDLIEHALKRLQVCKGLAAGEHKVAVGRDGVHTADALADVVGREASQVCVLPFVDTEGAVVFAVVGDENRHRSAAFPGFIGMFHDDRPFKK